MSLRIAFLGSGSSGNCALIEYKECRLLIDVGLGVYDTMNALRQFGLEIADLSLALLTHTHSDHLRDVVLRRMAAAGVPLVARAEHREALADFRGMQRLEERDLVRAYSTDRIELFPGLMMQPVALMHDSPATHGFVLEFRLGSSQIRFGYVADCGTATPVVMDALRDVEALALEFNHDEAMERQSRRPAHVIRRVLGPDGHLSNSEAADAAARIAGASLKFLVQIHLSRECNRPELAYQAGRAAFPGGVIYQAEQNRVGPVLEWE